MNVVAISARRLFVVGAVVLNLWLTAEPAGAQWVRGNEQFYLPARHNWVFRHNYIGADRLFNAFDYGHAILYETLYRHPTGPVERLEQKEYDFLTQRLLKRPPRVALEEGAVEIAYAKLAPEAKLMFEWAHVFHRQIYDVLADERLTQAEKDAGVAELIAYYRSRPDLAFSSVPKSMDIMDGQYYSLAFRESYPKFNGLIWAYHWLQVGLYEPLVVNHDVASRTAGVTATMGRFWQMLENPPGTMPYLMPMTAAIAPTFSERYPEAAIIFDNLHMMHDVISDILASPAVPRDRKRAEILEAAEMFRDDTSYAISVEEWAMMGEMMGIQNMGGRAVGFTAALPEPTVAIGTSMAGMDHSGTGDMQGMQHTDSAAVDHGAHAPAGAADHAAPGHVMPEGPGGMADRMSDEHMRLMHEMHMRMMADPVIRERMATDPVLRRMMTEMGHETGGPMMDHSATPTPSGADVSMEFVLRLLSDPEIEARIHADPRLHRLWSDPEVQRQLQLLRQSGETGTGVPRPARPEQTPPQPAAPGQPEHQH